VSGSIGPTVGRRLTGLLLKAAALSYGTRADAKSLWLGELSTQPES